MDDEVEFTPSLRYQSVLMLITDPPQVRFMWNSRINLVKTLYFANRYIPIANQAFAVYGTS